MDVRKVAASTQYGMGFLLVTEGAKHLLNGIAYRNDAMSQAERVQLAHDVNQILRPNDRGHPAAKIEAGIQQGTLSPSDAPTC